ncbi:unnamed protein product [Amoebophrya sp. A120]|nr:unnamed protein product [Amoebophrya sp. A120]|eukprot:GSA120T00011279001.1
MLQIAPDSSSSSSSSSSAPFIPPKNSTALENNKTIWYPPYADTTDLLAASQKDEQYRERFRARFAQFAETLFGSQTCHRYRAVLPRVANALADFLLLAGPRTLGEEYADLAPVVARHITVSGNYRHQLQQGQREVLEPEIVGPGSPVNETGKPSGSGWPPDNYLFRAERVPGFLSRVFLSGLQVATNQLLPAVLGASRLSPRTSQFLNDALQLALTLNRASFFLVGMYESLPHRLLGWRRRSLGYEERRGRTAADKNDVNKPTTMVQRYFYALSALCVVQVALYLRRLYKNAPPMHEVLVPRVILEMKRRIGDIVLSRHPTKSGPRVSFSEGKEDEVDRQSRMLSAETSIIHAKGSKPPANSTSQSRSSSERNDRQPAIDAPAAGGLDLHEMNGSTSSTVEKFERNTTAAPGLLRREELRKKPSLPPRTARPGGIDCNICFGEIRAPTSVKCGHVFCWDCAYSWVSANRSCPPQPNFQKFHCARSFRTESMPRLSLLRLGILLREIDSHY